MALTLAELLAPWPELVAVDGRSVRVTTVVEDSRSVVPGSVFVAVTGSGADGHAFVPQALAAGAAAVVVEADRLVAIRAALPDDHPVAWVTAPRTRGLPARLARESEGRPDTALTLVGVTGTNGKTTAAFLLQEALEALAGRCGLLGTIRYDDGRVHETAPLTTPGGPVLYRWLARMRDAGCRAGAMEISSHALSQDRPADLALDAVLLTNLGRDHLDYHADMAAYRQAKLRILELLGGPRREKAPGVAVVNAADPAFAAVTNPHGATIRFSVDPAVAGADLRVEDAILGLAGTRLVFTWRGQRLALASPLVGRYNVENLAAALAVLLGLGHDPKMSADALGRASQVPGRMERLPLPSGGLAVVDYAHTHDALAAVLQACRELVRGRLAVVFGCGGDRDRGKRPLMAGVAARFADSVWITSDNPRSEDPAAICAEVLAGFDATPDRRAATREVVVDRAAAIEAALAEAGEGDVVVIAGKGHEDYQLVGGRTLHLDDREVVRGWLARHGDGR